MKEHKNPKVLKPFLVYLTDSWKDLGLQSSTAATRNATIKLLGFLKPVILSELLRRQFQRKPLLEGWIAYLEKISVTPNLPKGFDSPDRKMRLESTEAVNKILEEATKRIQPTGSLELVCGQKCFYNSLVLKCFYPKESYLVF
ncbi:unnamed protein product [Arabidopsis halleri]